jgi:hypothetical protein
MERGLLWLPLLGVFVGLAWAGWHEFQKVQRYEAWASDFERSKYDIRAMLGQQGSELTWGRPTRRGPVDLTSLSLSTVTSLTLEVDGQTMAEDEATRPLSSKAAELVLTTATGEAYRIPFTDGDLARRWQKALQDSLQALKSASAQG